MMLKNKFIKDNSTIILILLLSLSVQLFFINSYTADPLESDATQYNLLAENLLHRGIFSLNGTTISMLRAPGYPFFISMVYLLFGGKVIAVQLAQVLLIMLICLFVYRIGYMVFDKKTGLLAAFITAIHPVFICLSFPLLSETLMAFLITASVYLAFISMRSHKRSHYILLGVLLGYSALTRPITLLLPFFVIFVLMFFYSWEKVAKFSIYFLLPFILITSSWIIRNYLHTGYIVPIQFMGGRSLWSGTYVPGIGFDEHPSTIAERNKLSEQFTREIKGSELYDSEESNPEIIIMLTMRKFRDRGLNNLTSNSIGFMSILPSKFARLYLGSYCYLYGIRETFPELISNRDFISGAWIKLLIKSLVLLISILFTFLSLIGLFSCRKKILLILPIIILFLFWNVLFIFFETMTRYSIPILPVLILLAVKGFYSLRGLLTKKGLN